MSDPTADAPDTLSRREFTLQSALALLATVVITVDEGCGSKTTPTPTTPTTPVSDVTGTVSANHGHTAVVTAAAITAGNGFSLNIQGNATHPHTVDMSQGDLTTLRNRQAVTKTSSTDNNHSHTVTFTPA